ncbi:uncharacterized protein LOC135474835 [Liolophura sinensis]|uniref:uncharacterized protein LOC135474835 n=1 Tax=Liolophura sinensis TaxID=3198878 RepID=UPI003157F6C5
MNRLLFASKHNMYVGYTHGEKVLFLMTPQFEIISSAKSLAPIILAMYNDSINEVITVGGGYFTAWRFRYNARYILPRKITKLTGYEEAEFTCLVLEPTASRSQRCFLALDSGVVEYSVYDGHFVAHYKDLHSRRITALTFFNPLKYLVTAAKDGCIKVWDKTVSVVMVFVTHTDAVNYLGVHPYGPAFMSASLDRTVRVWSLESCDEIDHTEIQKPVQGLCSQLAYDTFITFSGKSADLWNIQHLYQMNTSVGYRVFSMKHTLHPMFPKRSVLLCKDSSVRLVSPNSGDVITTLLQHPRKGLIDAAYAVAEGTMFVVTGRGSIVKCKTHTNPCTVVAEWEYPSEEFCNYLLVYEYVVDAMLKEDAWRAMKKTVETRSLQDTTKANVTNRNRTLLLGGRKDGYICVFNWKTGKVDFSVDAHGAKGVLSMIANSKEDQLISAGMDNIIKVWRLYPFAEEALAPLMSFYCGHTPSHMVMMKSALCVAFHDHSSATYSVVLYNLITKNRSDHQPNDDHQDTITGLTACHKLRLFATSSLDGTVRIWSDKNQLLRVLRLGVSPHSIGFCNQQGDLLLGIGLHVSKIPHTVYLPKKYLLKMSCMKFLGQQAEPPIPYDENLLNQLNKSDLKRLKNARASLKYDEYTDKLTSDEENEVTREAREREQGYATLEERENELRLLRDGAISCKKKPRRTARTQREALKQFMKLYHNRPKIQLPADKIFQGLQQEVTEKEMEGWIPEKEPTGFFPPTSMQKTKLDEGRTIPVGRGGFVPNSILLRLLWPDPPPVKIPEKRYQPPALQLQRTDDTAKPGEDARSIESYGDVSSTQQKKHDTSDSWFEDELAEREDEEEDKPLSPSNLLSKFEEMLKRSPSLTSENEEVVPVAEPVEKEEVIVKTAQAPFTPRAPAYDPPSEINKPEPLPKREPRPKRPIVKIVSQAPPLPAHPISALPERIPTPPAPPTPLPEFIMQFKGQEWFEKYFPNCNPDTLPKPWTVDAFASLLGRVMKIASYKHKVDISAALMTLHSMEDMEDTNGIARCYLSALNHHNPPTALVHEEKTFILTSLRALQTLRENDQGVIIELMIQYIDGDKDIRATSLDVLLRMGVADPHGYLAQELDSWDTWNLEETNRKSALHKMCQDWLDRWMASFKIHLEDTIEKLRRGQNVHGRLGQRQAAGSQASSTRKRSPGEDSVVDTSPKLERSTDNRPVSQNKKPPHHAITVNLDSVTDSSVLENATFVEAINYFCEITFEKEMEKLRRGPIPPISEEKSGQTKNTVLVLPKIQHKTALVRLGETHTSCCRPKRETSYNTDYRQMPPGASVTQTPDFPPSINLPMKKLYLNPFPSPQDTVDLRFQEPVLITLKSSQKYFIPEQSYCSLSMAHVNTIPAAR